MTRSRRVFRDHYGHNFIWKETSNNVKLKALIFGNKEALNFNFKRFLKEILDDD